MPCNTGGSVEAHDQELERARCPDLLLGLARQAMTPLCGAAGAGVRWRWGPLAGGPNGAGAMAPLALAVLPSFCGSRVGLLQPSAVHLSVAAICGENHRALL